MRSSAQRNTTFRRALLNVTELTIARRQAELRGERAALEYLAMVAARMRDFVVANTARA